MDGHVLKQVFKKIKGGTLSKTAKIKFCPEVTCNTRLRLGHFKIAELDFGRRAVVYGAAAQAARAAGHAVGQAAGRYVRNAMSGYKRPRQPTRPNGRGKFTTMYPVGRRAFTRKYAIGSCPKKALLKFHDVTQDSATVIADTGTILEESLNLIAQGTDYNDRIGRIACIKELYIKGFMETGLSTNFAATMAGLDGNGQSTNVRLMLIVDKQANGAPATVAQVLQSANPMSYMNVDNTGRFRVLKDKTYTFPRGGGALTHDGTNYNQLVPSSQKAFKFSIPKCDIPILFSAGTAAIGSVADNNIFFLAIANNGGGITDATAVKYHARLRYTDERH